jgi:hypothetical protein
MVRSLTVKYDSFVTLTKLPKYLAIPLHDTLAEPLGMAHD